MSEIQQVIFDGMILYDKEAAKITNLLDTKKVATLTVPANECLAIVLKNSPDVTTQKQLFHEVWEVHGIPINSNTFYQNISIIRKAFKQIDYTPDVLITIPRRGIVISKTIELQKVINHHFEEDESLSVSKPPTVQENITKKNKRYFNLSIFFFVINTILNNNLVFLWQYK